MESSIILSIKTKFADRIMSGEKTVELRRRFVGKFLDSHAFIYASGLKKKIVGCCKLVCSFWSVGGTPSVHDATREKACVSLDEFNKLFGGSECLVCYSIRDVIRYDKPYDLSDFGLSHAPQSWAYARCIPASILISGDVQ